MSEPLVISVENLKKSFQGKPAVKGFSLDVKRGDICGFLGPNGSGKTTTLRMLCGLLIPDAGSGQCLGYDILRHSFQIKQQVGYMTQSFSLYHDLTAQENLDLIARIFAIPQRRQRIEESLKTFELQERRHQLAGEMSGGWKQRLALAGCMIHQPKLLLLDEPTGGVDPRARRDFWDNIFRLSAEGVTTLVSTHYMDEAERCSRLVYIAYGDLLAEGTLQEIVKQCGLKTWRVQGANLMSLATQLRTLPFIDQVAFFGNALHVSGRDEARLDEAIAPYKTAEWEKISPGIEDAFISLVEKSENEG